MTKLPMHIIKIATIAIISALATSSCSKDEESEYAMMTAELCMLQSSTAKSAMKAETDNGVALSFSEPLTVSWATTPDSTYRALLYYNKVENSTQVKPLSAYAVSVLRLRTPEQAKKWSNEHDPIDIASAWRSKNQKWLNFNITIKTGSQETDEKSKHTLGVVCDSIITRENGRLIYCSMCHGQNGIPTYYSSTAYASIPIETPTDTFVVNVTTWKGTETKRY